MKSFILGVGLLVAALSFKSHAVLPTQTSGLVHYVQSKYANQYKKYPILIFDRDEVEYRFSQNQAWGEEKEKENLRIRIIQRYVKEVVGVELTHNEASAYEMYISILKDSAVALPTFTESWPRVEYKMCAVFPANANSNQQIETERILGLLTKEAYGELTYDHLKPRLSYEDLAEISLYHELSHCLDQEFMPDTYQSYEDSHSVHKSESFAETNALLLMAKEGKINVGRTRSLLRSLYSSKLGSYLAANPQNSFGNPHYMAGGAIYYLSPVIEKAQDIIDQNPMDFKTKTINQITAMAQELVKKYALSSKTFSAIAMYLDQPKETLQSYAQNAEEMPDFFEEAFKGLIDYIEKTNQVTSNAFSPTTLPVPSLGPSLLQIDTLELCFLFKENFKDQLFRKVELYRKNLRKQNNISQNQRQRAKNLKNLFEQLPTLCREEPL